ncbi:MAG: tetratricopeptide repeat protein [Candidatus Omnitrophota bacterium]|jgi:outer membrane protein assembly factor BamD (BamD/ComL family)
MLKVIITFFILFSLAGEAYCLDLERAKSYLMKGDYRSAMVEGEKSLAGYSGHHDNLDELYYILGLAYLKDGNYLRAGDIFEIILKEFKGSALKDEAELGLGDSYFLRGDYDRAREYYEAALRAGARGKLTPSLYYRLSQAALKQGDTRGAGLYLNKLKSEFPLSPEISLDKELYGMTDIYYTVQVGSFVNFSNARNLRDKLKAKGYDAYLEEADTNGVKTYRVRAGKLSSRQDAVELKGRLSSEGHPTKIIP